MKRFPLVLSSLILLISNIIVIYFAITNNWNILTIAFVYWGQSIIIGFFNFRKILNLKDFSVKNFSINHKPAEQYSKKFVKYFTAYFFLFHYGLFHFFYFQFLLNSGKPLELMAIFTGIGIFLVDHTFSYFYNRKRDIAKVTAKKPNIGKVMFYPYARIFPLHFSIVLGIFFVQSTYSLLFFLSLKTLADLVMHILEHKQGTLRG